MNLRELIIERILFQVSADILVNHYCIIDENFDDMSDLDILELYEATVFA
jgi:hypothetical protein